MGQEAQCQVRFGRKISTGKARLEHDVLRFSGQFRLAIPLKDIHSTKADDGELTVSFSGGEARFRLGSKAPKWEQKIRSPRSLIDKLGVKADMRVAVVGVRDKSLVPLLKERTRDVTSLTPRQESDLIFLGAEQKSDLKKLRTLQSRLRPNGAIWVVRPKGRREITEADVMAAGKAAGLVDVKVVSFSGTHTAEKFVIPINRR